MKEFFFDWTTTPPHQSYLFPKFIVMLKKYLQKKNPATKKQKKSQREIERKREKKKKRENEKERKKEKQGVGLELRI